MNTPLFNDTRKLRQCVDPGERFPIPVPDDYQAKSTRIFQTTALLGLEFEYEGTGMHFEDINPKTQPALWQWWHGVHDGSLRGADAIEFVLKHPMDCSGVENALVVLQRKSGKWQVSRRTGIHVHMNVSDMTFRQMYNLFSLYALLEPALFTAAGDERSANPFCVPWFKDSWVSRMMHSCASVGTAHASVSQLTRYVGKYAALNPQPVSRWGSVEFRHLRNTHDWDKIYNWINLLIAMRDFALDPEFDSEFERCLARRDYTRLIQRVYRDDDPWSALIYPELNDEVDDLPYDLASELYWAREEPTRAWVDEAIVGSKTKPKKKGKVVSELAQEMAELRAQQEFLERATMGNAPLTFRAMNVPTDGFRMVFDDVQVNNDGGNG